MKRSSFVATLATVALSISAILVGVTSANASITLPKGAFLPCSAGGGSYCIDSVSITPSGGKAIALTWVTTGSQGSAAGNTNGVAAGKDLPGRWSADGAFTNENYDGLYVEAQAANEFVPWIVLDAKPTFSPGNKVSLAATTTSATTPVNLNSDAVISVKMRISDFKLGVTYGIATEATVDVQSGVFEIAGYPVKVPQAKNTKDCSGDAGVSSALVTQFQSILVPSNDPLGFSFEGGSGKIYVGSNGLCKLSTPVWNAEKKSLSYKASAPRLAPARRRWPRGTGSRLGAGGRVGDHLFAGSQHLLDLERDDGHQQVALVAVVVVDGSDRHLCGRGNRLHLHRLIALLTEQPGGRIDDAVMTDGFLSLAEPGHSGSVPDFWN